MSIRAYSIRSTIALTCVAVSGHASFAAQGSTATPETVFVTATRTATTLVDVPQSVSVVPSDQIQATPAAGLNDILRNLPGLTLTNIGPDVGHPTAYNEAMRGLPTTDTRMLVMVDGVPVNDPFFGYIQWNLIPLDNIDHVEVVRGGGSPLWGNTAMGGVVNVITRAPVANELMGEAGGGSYGTYRTALYGAYAAEPWIQFSVNAAFSGTDGYQTTPSSWTSFGTVNLRSPVYTNTSSEARNIGLRAEFEPDPQTTGFVTVNYNQDRQILGTPIGLNRQQLWTYAGGIRESFTDSASLSVTYFHNDNNFITNNPHLLTFTTEYNSNIHTTTASDNGASLVFTQLLSGPVTSLSLGGDMHQISGRDVADYYRPSGALAAPTIIGGGDQFFLAGFAQVQIVPFDPLQILASLRYQFYRNYNGIDTFPPGFGSIPASEKYRFTPRVDARYKLDDEFAVRGGYYQSFRAPTLDQMYRTYADTTAGIFEGNPFLLPETLEGEEIGLDFNRSGFRSQFTLYDSTITNLITQRNLTPAEYPDILGVTCGFDETTFTYLSCTRNINSASAIARGFEAEINWDIGAGFSTDLTYTYADSHYTENPDDPTAVGERLEGVPLHNAGAGFTYLAGFGWQATAILRYISKSYGDAHPADGLIQQGHFVVDVSGSYPLTRMLQVYVQIQNLFDRRYIASNGGGPPILGTPFEVMSGFRARFE